MSAPARRSSVTESVVLRPILGDQNMPQSSIADRGLVIERPPCPKCHGPMMSGIGRWNYRAEKFVIAQYADYPLTRAGGLESSLTIQ
jgi:hypothetical protein